MFILEQDGSFMRIKVSKNDVTDKTSFEYSDSKNKVLIIGNTLRIFCNVKETRLLVSETIDSVSEYWFMGGHIAKSKKEAEKGMKIMLWVMSIMIILFFIGFAYFIGKL